MYMAQSCDEGTGLRCYVVGCPLNFSRRSILVSVTYAASEYYWVFVLVQCSSELQRDGRGRAGRSRGKQHDEPKLSFSMLLISPSHLPI